MDHINKRIFVIWVGNEEFTDTRKMALINLSKQNITLITDTNLEEFILKNFPLHPAYKYLSAIHKSDYLRCYLMYHYGGGYSDLKNKNINWDEGFTKMNNDKNIMIMGVKTTYEETYAGIEEWDENTKNNILSNIDTLFCMSYFICRPKSPIVSEWYNELNLRLDRFLPKLKKNPAKYPRECFHPEAGCAFPKPIWENPNIRIKTNYPVSWNILLCQILTPLQMKYLNNIDNTTL
jgi:hypothetical protein